MTPTNGYVLIAHGDGEDLPFAFHHFECEAQGEAMEVAYGGRWPSGLDFRGNNRDGLRLDGVVILRFLDGRAVSYESVEVNDPAFVERRGYVPDPVTAAPAVQAATRAAGCVQAGHCVNCGQEVEFIGGTPSADGPIMHRFVSDCQTAAYERHDQVAVYDMRPGRPPEARWRRPAGSD